MNFIEDAKRLIESDCQVSPGEWRKLCGELVAEVEGLRRGHAMLQDVADRYKDERDTFRTAFLDAEQDAERYRWLAADGDRALKVLTENSGHEVQAAIDAARGN